MHEKRKRRGLENDSTFYNDFLYLSLPESHKKHRSIGAYSSSLSSRGMPATSPSSSSKTFAVEGYAAIQLDHGLSLRLRGTARRATCVKGGRAQPHGATRSRVAVADWEGLRAHRNLVGFGKEQRPMHIHTRGGEYVKRPTLVRGTVAYQVSRAKLCLTSRKCAHCILARRCRSS